MNGRSTCLWDTCMSRALNDNIGRNIQTLRCLRTMRTSQHSHSQTSSTQGSRCPAISPKSKHAENVRILSSGTHSGSLRTVEGQSCRLDRTISVLGGSVCHSLFPKGSQRHPSYCGVSVEGLGFGFSAGPPSSNPCIPSPPPSPGTSPTPFHFSRARLKGTPPPDTI